MPNSLDACLLFAARLAYQVPPPGAPPLVPPPTSGLSQIETFIGGAHNINAAFLADCGDGVVLAFRGTLPPNSPDHEQTLLDWLNDANAVFVHGTDLPGLVHKGFRDTLDILWPLLSGPLLSRMRGLPTSTPLYITGHSKGGAVAFLAAMRARKALADAALDRPIIVCTFAAARPGDQDFANAFDQAIPHAVRYEYGDDLVPHVAPENALRLLLRKFPNLSGVQDLVDGFVSPGTLRYLARGNTPATVPQGSSALLAWERISSLVSRVARCDCDTIIKDHGIDPGSGYASAIVGTPEPV